MNKNKNFPLLTIAIPTFNGFKTITETLNSCLEGSSSEIDILIVDNGSAELTKEIIFMWIDKHKEDVNITYHRHPQNIGYDRNILSLFELARGQFVHILADDDAFYTGAIENLLNIIKTENNSIGGIVSNFDHYDTSLKHITNQLTINNNQSSACFNLPAFIEFSGGRFGQVSTITLKRESVNHLMVSGFIGTQYIHIYLIFKILLESGIFINSKAILKIRAGSPNFEKRGDDKILVPLGSLRIFRTFKSQVPYSFYLKYIFQNSLYLAKSIYGGKKQGLSKPFGTFIKLLKHEYQNPFYWLILLPIFLLPATLISRIKSSIYIKH